MRVMVYEPDHHGHRLTYARVVIEALLEQGCEVIFTTSEAAPGSTEYQMQIGGLERRIRLDPWLKRATRRSDIMRLRGMRAVAASFWESIDRCKPAHALVSTADGISQALGIFPRRLPPGLEIEGLLMRGKWAYPNKTLRDRMAAWVSLTTAKRAPWTTLYCLDELAVEAAKRQGGRLARVFQLMPHVIDPVERIPREAARRRLGLSSGKVYFGCIGALNIRKGIDVLINALGRPNVPPQVALLLLGKCDDSLTRHITSPAAHRLLDEGRLIIIDEYVEESMMHCAYAGLDCFCTLHQDTTLPSSVLLHAVAYGKPVLGSNSGWIEHMIRRFELGWTSDPSDAAAVSAQLARIHAELPSFRRSPSADHLVAFHTVANAKATWMRRIRERRESPLPAQCAAP